MLSGGRQAAAASIMNTSSIGACNQFNIFCQLPWHVIRLGARAQAPVGAHLPAA